MPGPLHLILDSTGIAVGGEEERNARRHGGPRQRIWRKGHPGIDEQTQEIQSIGFTYNDVGDVTMLPELPDQIPTGHEIGSFTTEGACDTRRCHDAIAGHAAHTMIPPSKTAEPWKPDAAGAMARNEALRASRQ